MMKKKNKKRFNLKDEYIKSWKIILDAKKFIYFAIGIFFFSSLIGFFIPVPEILRGSILEMIYDIIQKTSGMSYGELTIFIFLNNLQSSFLGLALGVFFGIFPIIFAMFNGYLIGFVSSYAVGEEGALSLWKLFPHGIFELPAIFISFGLGIKFGTFLFREDKRAFIGNFVLDCTRIFLLIIVPLLLIASIIETSLIHFFS